jgi:hypothetical protein
MGVMSAPPPMPVRPTKKPTTADPQMRAKLMCIFSTITLFASEIVVIRNDPREAGKFR